MDGDGTESDLPEIVKDINLQDESLAVATSDAGVEEKDDFDPIIGGEFFSDYEEIEGIKHREFMDSWRTWLLNLPSSSFLPATERVLNEGSTVAAESPD